MPDVNELSLDDLVKFAESGKLPDNLKAQAATGAEAPPAADEFDAMALSPEDLLAIAQGKVVDAPAEAAAPEAAGEAVAANTDDLLAMLENTLSEDELSGTSNQADTGLAKKIEKIKLRQLANRVVAMAPVTLFPPRKDEVYYFLTAMCGQPAQQDIEDANKKCEFIGSALQGLRTFMLSELGLSPAELDTLELLFAPFSNKAINAANARDLVAEQLKAGWRNTFKLIQRDVEVLKRYVGRPGKPLWVVVKFYESLSRSYGLCRAQDDMVKVMESKVVLTPEEKRNVITCFEDVLHISTHFGLKKLQFIDRKGAYEQLEKLHLDVILKALKQKK